ncbi:portal protein [Hypericibacter terrae]|uniref:Portal protein n=1 Tax=Hypericibacter terrae TaxID=2602015 RepID=A0A5J6MMX1_9PROT|nr:phage portal protein [Hypericibacter terrae]QEX18507.1 portal protein [Hypericibacter terrae]
MGLLRRIMEVFEYRSTVTPGVPPRDPVIAEWWGQSSMTASGVSVTPDSAMRVTAVYRCVKVLAETLATMPLLIWERNDNGKRRAIEHPLYPLLHGKPNERQTAFEFIEMMAAHTVLRGDSFARIIERGDGATAALIPLHPDRVQPVPMDDGKISYKYRDQNNVTVTLQSREVLRLPGLSLDGGVNALSPIGYHRETVGLSVAAREYLARFYSNNAAPKFGIKLAPILKEDAKTALIESWEKRHRGVENQHKLAIFDGGMEPFQLGLSNDDAQYLELQQFSVTDICRIFGVPPHKVMDLSKATFSNIEHQALEFVTDTVLPWVRRFEDRLNLSLLSPPDQARFFIGFEMKGLLRGDSAARAALYDVLFRTASISPNQIAAAEDMDGYEGGDTRYIPLTMAPADKILDVLLKDAGQKQSRENRESAT